MTLAADPRPDIEPERIHYTNGTGESFSILRFPFLPDRPLLHWAHANGFHGYTYLPLLRQLSSAFNVLAWDMRGHGHSQAAADPDRLQDWKPFYEDLTGFLATQQQPLLLAGHSVGAVCSLAAAARLGPAVSGLCLVDPILMAGPPALVFGGLKRVGQGHRHPLVQGALRRRRRFADVETALQTYRGKRVFADWDDAFLAAYVRHGFRQEDGEVTLCCEPEWEARQFATTEHDPWPWVEALACPVLLVQAARGSTIFPGGVRRFRALHPDTSHRVYSGTSHFVPMEAHNRLAADMIDFLGATRQSAG